jgi:hypothetical protein
VGIFVKISLNVAFEGNPLPTPQPPLKPARLRHSGGQAFAGWPAAAQIFYCHSRRQGAAQKHCSWLF